MNIYGITDAAGESFSRWDINDKLREIGISDEAIEAGTSEAIEAYAESNNIDLNTLLASFQAQRTPPVQQKDSAAGKDATFDFMS